MNSKLTFWLPIASANNFGYKITGTFSLHNLTALTVLISEQIRNATCSVLTWATVLGHRRFNSFFCIYLLLIQPSININNKPNIGRLSGRPNPLFYLKCMAYLLPHSGYLIDQATTFFSNVL